MKCVECGREHTAKWYSPKTNPTCASCYRRAYVAKNPEKVANYFRQYNASEKAVQARKEYEKTEKGKAARKKAEKGYYERNPDKMKLKRDTPEQRQRLRKHYAENKGMYREKANRRARELDQASLHGRYVKETAEIYDALPEGMNVDHIVPRVAKGYLNGELVQIMCGLHVPWNLQYLDEKSNKSKNCKLLLTDQEYLEWVRDRLQNN